MANPYHFEYNGHSVDMYPGTVRTSMEEYRLRSKLALAHGYVGGDIPDDDWGNFTEYAAAMARTKTDAAWWSHSNMSDEQIKAAYELFTEQDEELWLAYRVASTALRAPKKTPPLSPVT